MLQRAGFRSAKPFRTKSIVNPSNMNILKNSYMGPKSLTHRPLPKPQLLMPTKSAFNEGSIAARANSQRNSKL